MAILIQVALSACMKELNLSPEIDFTEPYTNWGDSPEEVMEVTGSPSIAIEVQEGRMTLGYIHEENKLVHSTSYLFNSDSELIASSITLDCSMQQAVDQLQKYYYDYDFSSPSYGAHLGDTPDITHAEKLVGVRNLGGSVMVVYADPSGFLQIAESNSVHDAMQEILEDLGQ